MAEQRASMRTEPQGPQLHYDSDQLTTVCQELGLRLVVLYGSRATGTPPPAPDSDLDLAVSGAHGSRIHFMTWYRALADVFRMYDIDLALLSQADPLFRYEIFRQGRLLYGAADDFLAYRAYAHRDFVDSADLRRLEEVLFHKKLAFIRKALHATP